ncbi:hypothetical protein M5K25_016486 [Dendrobium thyrsiflorum]|uniref:Major coat protein L-A virus domain-containing protein n=1 Tax=Dendrobium thyrsiflorum TaxID=117978 RepID=A0ABD0UKP6_DENTH
MDSFVKQYFPDFQSPPGADFVYDDSGMTHAYYDGILKVFDEETTQNRRLHSSQPMATVGLFMAEIGASASSLDGINIKVLTTEGGINMSALYEALKASAGLKNAMLSAHMEVISRWPWADNHVALLVNMLRYCLLKKIEECRGSLSGKFGKYDDGHVFIDMDQWWPEEDYVEVSDLKEWRTPNNRDSYPAVMRLTDSVPATEDDAINVRELTSEEAAFVIYMLAPWTRRSRHRLDFSTPMLTEQVLYRSNAMVVGVTDWLEKEKDFPRAERMKVISSKTAWRAIKAYVAQNRMYEHFSTAMYLIGACMYQFKPVTAEATWWCSQEWCMTMPKFQSIRGRYELMLFDIPALISHRALREWGFINGQLDKLNLMALIMAQAAQTGMAVRAARRGMEEDPNDLHKTEGEYSMVHTFYSTSMSEGMKVAAPMSGMPNAYVYVNVRPDDYVGNRYVMTDNDPEEIQEGYEMDVTKVHLFKDQLMELDPDDESIPEGERVKQKKKLDALTAGLKAILNVDPSYAATGEFKAASKGKILFTVKVGKDQEKCRIRLPWLPFAGVPTMLVPINPFPYNSPFTLKGSVEESLGELGRNGFLMRIEKAWTVVNMARLCGYDMKVRFGGDTAGPSEFFAPNDVQMVWPVLWEVDEQNMKVSIVGQKPRDRVFIQLPPMYNSFFKKRKLTYLVDVQARGVAKSLRQTGK